MNADDLTLLLHETVDGVAPAAPALAPVRTAGRRRLVRRRVVGVLGTTALAVVAVTGAGLALQPSGHAALSYTDGSPTPGPSEVDPTTAPAVEVTLPPHPAVVLPAWTRDEWTRHGEAITFSGDGGTWVYRTYAACTQTRTTACDTAPDGGHATVTFRVTEVSQDGRVLDAYSTSTTDPDSPSLGDLTLTLDEATGQLLLSPPQGSIDANRVIEHFCGSQTKVTGDCGA